MKPNIARKELRRLRRVLGSLNKEQLDFFLKKNCRQSFQSIERLAKGVASWKDLKNYSYFASLYNDHEFYDQCLNIFNENVDLYGMGEKKFFGSGSGNNTLNSYRKVFIDGCYYIEKVYNIDSLEYSKTKFFYREINPLLNSYSAPEAFFIEMSGIALAYFKYIEGDRCSDEELVFYYKNISLSLNSLDTEKLNRIFLDFKSDAIYNDALKKTKKYVDCIDFDRVESNILNNSKFVFSHGDLHSGNVIGSHLIDFDNCGFYPDGYDFCFLLSRLVEGIESFESFLKHELCPENRLLVYYFTLVFYVRNNFKSPDSFFLRYLAQGVKYYC